jgi:hypothetical protein
VIPALKKNVCKIVGGVLSPLLSNIYLDSLDTYVEKTLISAYTRGKKRATNPEWNQAQCKAKYWRQKGQKERARPWEKRMREIPSVDTHDPDYRRLRYTRYADDGAPRRREGGLMN